MRTEVLRPLRAVVLAAALGGATAQLGAGILGANCGDNAIPNSVCEGVSYADGDVLEVTGPTGALTFIAGQNASSHSFCANLNGTDSDGTGLTGCWPCKFTASDNLEMQETCYTANGMFTPAGVHAGDATTYNIGASAAGCDACNEIIDPAEQGGLVGTTCFVHEDCREGSYCDHLAPANNKNDCNSGQLPALFENGVCNSPFECAIGTDAADCPQFSSVCVSCGGEDTWSQLQCHSMSPTHFRNFVLHSSEEMLAVYFTLALCTAIYPIWCLVVFVLKNSTRCCTKSEEYTWCM